MVVCFKMCFLLVFVSKWLSLIFLVRFQHTLETSTDNWNGCLEHVAPFKHGGFGVSILNSGRVHRF